MMKEGAIMMISSEETKKKVLENKISLENADRNIKIPGEDDPSVLKALEFIKENVSFFAAPFTDQKIFQAWVLENPRRKELVSILSEDLFKVLNYVNIANPEKLNIYIEFLCGGWMLKSKPAVDDKGKSLHDPKFKKSMPNPNTILNFFISSLMGRSTMLGLIDGVNINMKKLLAANKNLTQVILKHKTILVEVLDDWDKSETKKQFERLKKAPINDVLDTKELLTQFKKEQTEALNDEIKNIRDEASVLRQKEMLDYAGVTDKFADDLQQEADQISQMNTFEDTQKLIGSIRKRYLYFVEKLPVKPHYYRKTLDELFNNILSHTKDAKEIYGWAMKNLLGKFCYDVAEHTSLYRLISVELIENYLANKFQVSKPTDFDFDHKRFMEERLLGLTDGERLLFKLACVSKGPVVINEGEVVEHLDHMGGRHRKLKPLREYIQYCLEWNAERVSETGKANESEPVVRDHMKRANPRFFQHIYQAPPTLPKGVLLNEDEFSSSLFSSSEKHLNNKFYKKSESILFFFDIEEFKVHFKYVFDWNVRSKGLCLSGAQTSIIVSLDDLRKYNTAKRFRDGGGVSDTPDWRGLLTEFPSKGLLGFGIDVTQKECDYIDSQDREFLDDRLYALGMAHTIKEIFGLDYLFPISFVHAGKPVKIYSHQQQVLDMFDCVIAPSASLAETIYTKEFFLLKDMIPSSSVEPDDNGFYVKAFTHYQSDAQKIMCLMLAVITNRLDCAKTLLEAGANQNVGTPHERCRPLHLAAMNKFPEMITLLLEFDGNPHSRNVTGQTPLRIAETIGDKACIEAFAESLSYRKK